MKKIWIRALCLALCLCLTPFMAMAQSKDATSVEVAKILQQKSPRYVILDIRTPQEFSQGHLKDAVMIDFMAPGFNEKISKLDKNGYYILHCRTGARSSRAKVVMEKLGFRNVVHMADGIMGWISHDLPVVRE